jgi:hypothetical protein
MPILMIMIVMIMRILIVVPSPYVNSTPLKEEE